MLPFCGPTIYHLSGMMASSRFTGDAWDVDRAAAGVEEAGFAITTRSMGTVSGTRGNLSMGADQSGNTTFRAFISVPTQGQQGERDEVERAAAAIIAAHEADVEMAMSAFARGSGWTIDAPIEWDKGMLHGDC